MFDKLDKLLNRYDEINKLLESTGIAADIEYYTKLTKELYELQPIAEAYLSYKSLILSIDNLKAFLAMTDDHELLELAKEDLKGEQLKLKELENKDRKSTRLNSSHRL